MPNNKQQHHAIVIGINSYPQLGQGSLEGPVNDANDFYDWLRDPEGGDVPAGNIRRILSSDFGQQAACPTPNQVEALFEPFIADYYDGKKEGERLYIFAAGHGFGDPKDIIKTAIYAANAKKMLPWHIAVTDYAEWLRRHAVFDEIVLIMDCCRTINLSYEIREPQYVAISDSINSDNVRYFYAFGTRRSGMSRERLFDDGKVSGVFTRAMIDALKIARPNNQNEVTGQCLKDHLHNSISRFAGNVTVKQPDIRLESDRDIVFFKRKSAGTAAVRINLAPYTGAETLLLYDGSLKKIKKMQADSAVLALELEPGIYKVAVENTSREKFFEVPNNAQIIV